MFEEETPRSSYENVKKTAFECLYRSIKYQRMGKQNAAGFAIKQHL